MKCEKVFCSGIFFRKSMKSVGLHILTLKVEKGVLYVDKI